MTTTGIPPDLYRRTKDVLLQCDCFGNFNTLKAIFADGRISLWVNELYDAPTAAARVQLNIDFLRGKYNAMHENGLVLLLRVLSDATNEADEKHQELMDVADALEAWLNSESPLPPPAPPSPPPHLHPRARGILWAVIGGISLIAAILIPSLIAPANRCPQALHSAHEDLDAATVFITGMALLMGDENLVPPEHEVIVESFRIDRYEVTNLQYKRFIDAEGYPPPDTWKGDNYPSDAAFAPVAGVMWQDAVAYCMWVGKRLPTEAEWELACRGAANNLYPWGDKPRSDRANVTKECGDTLAVGGYSPAGDTPYGVSDMIGNVSEWTSSIFMAYPYRENDGREDATDLEAWRTIRGGSFELGPPAPSCVARLYAPPSMPVPDVGFRCAQDGTSP